MSVVHYSVLFPLYELSNEIRHFKLIHGQNFPLNASDSQPNREKNGHMCCCEANAFLSPPGSEGALKNLLHGHGTPISHVSSLQRRRENMSRVRCRVYHVFGTVSFSFISGIEFEVKLASK